MSKRWLLAVVIAVLLFVGSPRAQAASITCSTPGQNPTGLAVDYTHTAIWVALWSAASVAEVDQLNCVVLHTVPVGTNPDGVAFDGRYVWVANFGSNTVTQIDSNSATVVRTISVGSGPRGVTVDSMGQVWVANYNSNTVTRIGSTVTTTAVGSGPYFPTFNQTDSNIYVPNRNSNTVTVLSMSGVTVRTVGVCTQPQFATSTGSTVFVSCYSSQHVDRITTAGVVTQGSAPHNSPTGIVYGSGVIWGVENSGYIYSMDPNSLAVGNTSSIGGTNYDCTFANGALWVTNYGGNALLKVSVP